MRLMLVYELATEKVVIYIFISDYVDIITPFQYILYNRSIKYVTH